MQTSEPGSVHDSLVFGRSEFFRQLNEENFCPFPGAMGVGDSAYKVNFDFFTGPTILLTLSGMTLESKKNAHL